jgi:hypothetical protein
MGTLLSEVRESARIWRAKKKFNSAKNFLIQSRNPRKITLPSTRIDSDHQACTDRELKGLSCLPRHTVAPSANGVSRLPRQKKAICRRRREYGPYLLFFLCYSCFVFVRTNNEGRGSISLEEEALLEVGHSGAFVPPSLDESEATDGPAGGLRMSAYYTQGSIVACDC